MYARNYHRDTLPYHTSVRYRLKKAYQMVFYYFATFLTLAGLTMGNCVQIESLGEVLRRDPGNESASRGTEEVTTSHSTQ